MIKARSNLRKYQTIFSITHGLLGLGKFSHRNNANVLFWLASNNNQAKLSEIERSLRRLGVAKLPGKLRDQLAFRLTNPREEACISAISEIHTAYSLSRRFGKTRVRLYPTNPKKGPDAEAIVHLRPVYFEATTIGSGMTDRKLRMICEGISKKIHGRIAGRWYVRANISSERLRRTKKGRFLVQPSIDMVLSSFDRLNLSWFIGKKGHFERLTIAGQAIMRQTISPVVRRLANRGQDRFFQTSAFKKYIAQVAEEVAKDSPIVYLNGTRFPYRIVETACEMSYPSKASEGEQSGCLDRIEKRIVAKIRSGQLLPGQPNVLVVNASNWTLGYDLAQSEWQMKFAPLKKRLRLILSCWRPPDLSAIMMYENDIRAARIVGNRFVGPASRLTKHEEKLLARRVIARSRSEREATRLRKRIIPSKIEAMKRSVSAGYESFSRLSKLVKIVSAPSDTNQNLKQIGIRLGLDKDQFRDPAAALDFSDFGRVIAEREANYLINSIIRSADDGGVWTVSSWKMLSDIIEKFNSTTTIATALFVPIRVYSQFFEWPRERRRHLTFEGTKPTFITTKGTRIPVYILSGHLPNDFFIIYSKSQGEWAVKLGNMSDRLSISVVTKDKIELTAYTESEYRVSDSKAALRFSIQKDTPGGSQFAK